MALLPSTDIAYLAQRGLAYDETVDGGRKGVILRRVPLPPGKYDAESADVLILLPQGYPDLPPDMFHLLPWVKLASTNQYPKAADVPVDFASHRWQRWSRHSREWRAGIDGIWTMVKRIEAALAVAA